VTGTQKTEPHHVESAFVICLETAKLVITEFRESNLDSCINPANAPGHYQQQKTIEPAIVECGQRPLINEMVHGLRHEVSLRSMFLGAARDMIYFVLLYLGWYWLK
jgi:hypothetical protein